MEGTDLGSPDSLPTTSLDAGGCPPEDGYETGIDDADGGADPPW